MKTYQHTQKTLWPILLAVFLTLYCSYLYFYSVKNQFPTWLLLLLFGFSAAIALNFSKLAVTVKPGAVTVAFGMRLIQKTIPLDTVASCTTVKNKWYFGYGIRYIGSGWMWNISGLDAVELRYKNNSVFRIGTDQPKELEQALRAQLEQMNE